MPSTRVFFVCTGIVGLALAAVACADASSRTGFDETQKPTDTDTNNPATGDFDNTKPPPDAGEPVEVNEVYGHSRDTLFKLDPKTKDVTSVGTFKDCGTTIIDIALDEASNLYGAGDEALYRIDKLTAQCTEIATGRFPNSLSFVPKGTVDPNSEALVGYVGDEYFRIDVATGQTTKLGALGTSLGKNVVSSGDIVSVKGGATYLTVKGGTQCASTDCLVEVDPATGAIKKNWKSIEHAKVFGLAFWGGRLYGFSDGGDVFEVTFGTNQVATQEIQIPSKPTDLSFWGAGSSTSAPLVFPPS